MDTSKAQKLVDHHGSMPDVSCKSKDRIEQKQSVDTINSNVRKNLFSDIGSDDYRIYNQFSNRNLLYALCLESPFNISTTTISDFSNSNSNCKSLYKIAQEIHAKTGNIRCSYNDCSCKQYHSWPKHKRKKKTSDKLGYHNFGLIGSVNGSLYQNSIEGSNLGKLSQTNRFRSNFTNDSSHVNTDVVKEKAVVKKRLNKYHNGDCIKDNLIKEENFQLCNSKYIDEPKNPLCKIQENKTIISHHSNAELHGAAEDDCVVEHINGYLSYTKFKSGINPPLFKTRSDIMLDWFSEFNDEQKNIFIQRIMEVSGLPQMHMLSLKMAPILHNGCPQNCQDMLQWLPEGVVYQILEFLDPLSLASASQVNRTWYSYAIHSHLWQKFCLSPDYCLPTTSHLKQIEKFKSAEGSIEWRELFIARYICKKNWKKGHCKIKSFIGHTQGVSCVQFDCKRIVSGSSDKTIRVWDLHSKSNEPILTLIGHSGTVRCLHLNGNRVISGSADNTIKVWDLSIGADWNMAACKVTMEGHLHTVRCLQVDHEKVISGSYDMTLKVWDLFTGICKLTLRGHTAAVLCVQFDDEKILSGSADKTIKVWSLKNGECLTTLHGHLDSVTCLQFNRDRIISGSLDCTLKFWNLKDGYCIGTIDWIRSEGHTRVVRCLQADNWKIVSAGDDKTLKVWSLETGERFVTLYKHTDGVTCLQFNDHMIVSGSYDKTVKVWDFSPTK